MYSVILTELGISVFKDEKLEKAFPFSNSVKEYLLVKSKESKLNELINHLALIQRAVSVSDESLLAILKKYSIDCHLMDSSELENIQATKPQIIVDSGFASNPQDALGKLREFALGLSSSKVTEVSASPDLHIIQAIGTLDEIDKISNALSSRLREWYGLHFPELDNIIDSINGYAQIVVAGKRESLTKQVFEDAGFPESKIEMLSLISSKSRGGDISDVNLAIVQSMAKQILDLHDLRKKLEEHVESEMQEIAPNLTAILGAAVGARILGRAGSLKRLASLPASTIQVLGAEKALFRSLKTGSQPPKHGLLFQHSLVHAAPRWQRGKIARAVAAKAVIAGRVDVYGEGLNETLLEKLNIRVDEIGKKYENPTEKDIRKPGLFRREGGNFGDSSRRRDDRGGRRDDRGGRRDDRSGRRDDRGGKGGWSSGRRDDRNSGRRDDRGGRRDDRGGNFGDSSRRRDDRNSGREDRGGREDRNSGREDRGGRRDDRGGREDRGGNFGDSSRRRDDRNSGRDDRGGREDRGSGRDDRGGRENKDRSREGQNYRERSDSNKKRKKFGRR